MLDGFIRDMIKAAEQAPGWRVERLRNGHWRFMPPTGIPVVAGCTPGSSKASVAVRCKLRRLGLAV